MTSLEPEILRESWFLAGPTASGKSEVSLCLAERLNAEIISLDSMAVYRGMDIGTAKPGRTERAQVRHHLIDVADPHEEFSVAEFVRMAGQAAAAIVARGRIPLFVGGTGLYLRSLLRGLCESPASDRELRLSLEQEARVQGNAWIHAQLRTVDPASADRLHVNDIRRVIRAIEVYRTVGQPVSEIQQQRPCPPEDQPRAVVWLAPPRDWLYRRIDQRVDRMMAAGLLEETRQLLLHDPPPGRTARQALGYRELIAVLEGRVAPTEAVRQIQTATRQFAKRQHTWFRNLPECTALPFAGNESPPQIADEIQSYGRRGR